MAETHRRQAATGVPLLLSPLSAFARQPLRYSRIVPYIANQHRRGRRLTDILEDTRIDRYSRDHRRLLASTELVHALHENMAAELGRGRTNGSAATPAAAESDGPSLLDMLRALHG